MKDRESGEKNRIGYVATNGDLLNVRSEASITSDIIGTIAKNKEVKITGAKLLKNHTDHYTESSCFTFFSSSAF